MKTIIAISLALLAVVTVAAQRGGSDPPGVVRSVSTPQTRQAEEQVKAALTQRTAQLGACNAELGQLQQFYAKVLSGELAPVAETLAKAKAQFEQANKGKTLANDFTIVDVPEPKK